MTRQKHRNVKFISSRNALYNFYNAIKLLSREECENGCWIHGSLCWFKLILSFSSFSGHHLSIQLKYFLPFRERWCCVRQSHVVLCVHSLNNLSTHSARVFSVASRCTLDSLLCYPMGDKATTILVISNILCRLAFINCAQFSGADMMMMTKIAKILSSFVGCLWRFRFLLLPDFNQNSKSKGWKRVCL